MQRDLANSATCTGDINRHASNVGLTLGGFSAQLTLLYDAMTSLISDNVTKNMAMKIVDKSRGDHLERRH